MSTAAFIFVVAYGSAVITAAGHHGRSLHRVHRIARLAIAAGVLLTLPAMLIGAYGPTGTTFRWSGPLGKVGYAGLALAVVGFAAWLIADSVFVWRHRRRVFPFAFRGGPGSEG